MERSSIPISPGIYPVLNNKGGENSLRRGTHEDEDIIGSQPYPQQQQQQQQQQSQSASRCARCGQENTSEGGGGSCSFCRRTGTNSRRGGDRDHSVVVKLEHRNYDTNSSIANYDSPYPAINDSNSNSLNHTHTNNDNDQHHQPDCEDTSESGRKWEYFPGKNKFYCDGRVMTAPSIRFCVLSFGLIFVTFVLFIIFDGPYLADKLTVAIPIIGAVLFISVVVNMLKTSCSDPGILPRASQQESEFVEKSYGNANNFRPPPRTKDIVVNGQTIKSKYCFTCKMFRPPRASHCGVCDNCVDRFDHHCPFLGNCIGKRNYRSFYAFIVSLSLLAVFVLSCSITHLALLSKEKGNFLDALRDTPTSAVVVLISFFGMWTVIGLAGFHTYLIAVEQTTNEDIKGMFGRANAKNPYSRGNFCQNCCFVLCGPTHPSLIDPRGYATVEFLTSLPKKSDPNNTTTPSKCNPPASIKPNVHCGEGRGSDTLHYGETPQQPQPVNLIATLESGSHKLATTGSMPPNNAPSTNGKVLMTNSQNLHKSTSLGGAASESASRTHHSHSQNQMTTTVSRSSRPQIPIETIPTIIHQPTNNHHQNNYKNHSSFAMNTTNNSNNGSSSGNLSNNRNSSGYDSRYENSIEELGQGQDHDQGQTSLSMVHLKFDGSNTTRKHQQQQQQQQQLPNDIDDIDDNVVLSHHHTSKSQMHSSSTNGNGHHRGEEMKVRTSKSASSFPSSTITNNEGGNKRQQQQQQQPQQHHHQTNNRNINNQQHRNPNNNVHGTSNGQGVTVMDNMTMINSPLHLDSIM